MKYFGNKRLGETFLFMLHEHHLRLERDTMYENTHSNLNQNFLQPKHFFQLSSICCL